VAVLSTTAAASAAVSVFPVPGDRVVSPQAQIAFRGIPTSQFGTIVVRGSQSGLHTGTIQADSDGQGGSFLPSSPFAPGETVTVSTSMQILGASNGRFTYTIASPAGTVPFAGIRSAARVPGDVLRFHSRPDLTPAAVRITRQPRGTAPGDIFLAAQRGPLQDGPMILGPQGGLIWYQPAPKGDSVTCFQTQSYQGKPVLTWWQGYANAAVGVGEDVIVNSNYQQIATVRAANGQQADLHEFRLTPQGTALISVEYPVYWDASSDGGSTHQLTFDSVVQEIDIPTGLVLFEWDSLDHVPVTDSYVPAIAGNIFDFFHLNSVQEDTDGSIVISSRNTSTVYKLNAQTGAIIWQLGGKRSTFKLGRGVRFAFQHDVEIHNHDSLLTVFDNGGGPPRAHHSRGLTLRLNQAAKTASVAVQDNHSPAVDSEAEGNVQLLGDGHDFVGWGDPYFSEYDSHGRNIFDAHFVGNNSSYRTYRLQWHGTPLTKPAVAASAASGGSTTVYASWDGATSVTGWRVLAGDKPTSLKTVRTVSSSGFETAARFHGTQPYEAVQALGGGGRVLASSLAVHRR
jgi:outer membrane protein assembly factor BamB